jgi:hypothetical protein
MDPMGPATEEVDFMAATLMPCPTLETIIVEGVRDQVMEKLTK